MVVSKEIRHNVVAVDDSLGNLLSYPGLDQNTDKIRQGVSQFT